MTLTSPLFLSILFFFACLGGDWIVYRRHRRKYPWRESYLSFLVVLIDVPVALLLGHRLGGELGPRGLSFPVHGYRMMDPNHSGWLPLILAFIAADFSFYATHWVYHRFRIFWIYHSTHHASEDYHFLLGLRTGVFRYAIVALSSLIFFSIYSVVHFPLQLFLAFTGLVFFYQSFLHLEFFPKLGFLEYIFITPANHRIHHANNIESPKNFGGMTTLWDHLFGTYAFPKEQELVFGIGAPTSEIQHPIRMQTFALREYCRTTFSAPKREN